MKKLSDELGELRAFSMVATSGGFREAARHMAVSASGLSDAVRRLESRLGVRLLHRNTRNILLTDQGQHLLERIAPLIAELDIALAMTMSGGNQPAGTLRLNVPVNTARLWLPKILPAFLQRYPAINVEIIAQTDAVELFAMNCDAGIRYGELLEQDMIAVPVGPRVQRFATAASPDYLARYGRPTHPSELLEHVCIRSRFAKGRLEPWVYEQAGESVTVDPPGGIIVSAGTASDLAVASALSGLGVIYLFEEWLEPYLSSQQLEPVLQPWWQPFPGPYLYYSGRKHVPPALRAFIDFVKGA
ncbi:LysR family transcriptional regulator [Klebsiella sp. R390]|uniref:LysR family transcriptional regulator n=1 Tax=Klebsiella sp. R390 TaxID=2755400 RepID=UPI003DA7BD2D